MAVVAICGVAETSTSETPSRPTRNVTTDAGACVNEDELKPVTLASPHLAGLTLTPSMVCLLVFTSGSAPYSPAWAGLAGASPLTLVSSAVFSWLAVKALAAAAVAVAAPPADWGALALLAEDPPPQPATAVAPSRASAVVASAGRGQ